VHILIYDWQVYRDSFDNIRTTKAK